MPCTLGHIRSSITSLEWTSALAEDAEITMSICSSLAVLHTIKRGGKTTNSCAYMLRYGKSAYFFLSEYNGVLQELLD